MAGEASAMEAVLSKFIISFQASLRNNSTARSLTANTDSLNNLANQIARYNDLKEREIRLKELELGVNSSNNHFMK